MFNECRSSKNDLSTSKIKLKSLIRKIDPHKTLFEVLFSISPWQPDWNNTLNKQVFHRNKIGEIPYQNNMNASRYILILKEKINLVEVICDVWEIPS